MDTDNAENVVELGTEQEAKQKNEGCMIESVKEIGEKYSMYVVTDCESGGIDADKVSLLTGCLHRLDHNLQPLELVNFALKSDVYHVTAEALSINKINLIEHHAVAETEDAITVKLNHLLKNWSTQFLNDPKAPDFDGKRDAVCTPLVLIGHNVAFDRAFLKARLPGVKWDKYISYRVQDTQTISRFLQTCGLLPYNLKMSLRHLAEYLQIPDKHAHTAEGDVLVTAEVYRRLRMIVATMTDHFKNQEARLLVNG